MPPKRKSKDDNFGGEPAPSFSELPTPPKGTRIVKPAPSRTRRAISWTWKNRKKRRVQWGVGCGSFVFLCAVFAVFGFIGQTLGFIPDATERAQTRTATAAVFAAAQAATSDARQGTEAAENRTSTAIALSATPTPTDEPSNTPRPSSTPQLLATQPPTTAALNFLRTNTPEGVSSINATNQMTQAVSLVETAEALAASLRLAYDEVPNITLVQ